MQKNSKDLLLRKIDQHNRNIPKTVFQLKPQQFLVKHETFGISNQNIFGQFSIIGKDSILYYCSSMLVIKSIEKNTSTFLYKQGRLKNVSSICSTLKQVDEKEMIIIAGQGSSADNSKACLNIIAINDQKQDWKLIQTLHRGRIQYIQINPNKTKVGCLIVTPEQTYFNLYSLDKHVLLVCSVFKSNDIKRFTFDLNNEKLLYIYGQGLLKLHQINTTQRCFKDLGINLLIKQNKDSKFIDHIWIYTGNHKQSYNLILISNAKVFIIKNQNIIRVFQVDIQKTKIKSWHTLKLDYTKDVQEERPTPQPQQIRLTQKFQLKCLMKDFRHKKAYDDSLILGASNGLLILLDLTSTQMNVYQIFSNEQMISLTSSPSRNMIASISKDYYEQNLCFNLIRPQMLDSDDFPSRTFFGEGCHFNNILSLSVSCSRQMFSTISADKSIRVWNYSTKQSIIYGNYKQTPICTTIHPSGFYLAMAFPNQIELYSILSNSLYLLKSMRNLEEIKSIKFSHKGDFLISNQSSCLKIYDPFNFRVISMYQMDDGRIPILQYALDCNNSKIVAVYSNGNVFCWEIVEGQSNLPSIPSHVEPLGYKHMIFDEGIFIGSNQNKYMSLYKDDCKTLVNQFPVTDSIVTSLILSKQLSILFVGTNTGDIRLYEWPISQNMCYYQIIQNSLNKVRLLLPSSYELNIHNNSVTSLGVSQDNRYLFSGLDNGGVMMIQIKGLKTKQQRNQQNKDLLIELKQQKRKIKQKTTSLVLICQNKIRDKNDQLTRMQTQLNRIQQQIDKQKLGRQKHLKRMQEQKIQMYSNIIIKDKQTQTKTITTQNKQINRLVQDYQWNKTIFDHLFNQNLLNHQRSKQYQTKRKQKIKLEIKSIKQQHISKLNGLLSSHRVKLNSIKNQYKNKGQSLQSQYKQIVQQSKLKYDQQIIDIEQQQQIVNKQKLQYLNKIISDLKLQYKHLQQNCIKNKQQDQQIQIKFNKSLTNQNNCRLKNIKSREQILKIQHQLNQRIGIIRQKQQAYKQAKQDQMNLQNYKSLIDDRIIALQENKKNLIDIIQQKDSELETLFNQLISATQKNDKKQFQINNLQNYKQHLQGNAKRAEIQIFFGMKRLKSYQQFIQNILSSKLSQNKIHSKIVDFLSKPLQQDLQMIGYLQKLKITNKDMKQISKLKQQKGNQQNNILQNQGKAITKKFNLMKFTCKKMKDIHETNINYTLKQNQKLLQQCNLLRYQNLCYQKQIRKIQKFINLTIQERRKLAVRRKSGEKLMLVQNKLKANQLSLKQQAIKLQEIRQFISNIKDDVEEL